jgi:DNA processing protein
VSEFPPATAPRAFHFPRRNRIISGLSAGLLVVEAAIGSGSLTTADSARTHNRKLFAIPGSIRNPTSRGCHALIRSGATLVEHPSQILQEMQFSASKQVLMDFRERPRQVPADLRTLDKAYKILLDAAGFETVSLDVLVERTGLPSQSVASMLLILELEGLVGRQADGRYVRL